MEPDLHHPTPEFLSENLLKLDAIFEEVQKNLPTIDFELSDVSSEEDVPIFHRHLKAASGDEAEDDDAWDEEPSTPRDATTTGNPTLSEMRLASQVKEASTSSVGCGTDDGEDEGEDEGGGRPELTMNTWMRDPGAEPTLDPKQQASMFISPSAPKLSLTRAIENLMLGNGPTNRDPIPNPGFPNNNSADPNDEEESNVSLIQRLASLSVEQSGTQLQDVDPETGALKVKSILKKDGKTLKDSKTALNKSVVKCTSGTCTDPILDNDRPNLPRNQLPNDKKEKSTKTKRDTVYIDLRGFDKNKQVERENMESIQRILQITQTQAPPETSSDSDSDPDEEMWHEQRRRIKHSLQTSGKMPTQRALARPIPRNQPSTPPMRTQAQRLAGHLPPKRKAKERLQGEFVEPEAEPQKLSTHTKAKVQAIEEKERSRKLDLAKIRDQKEHERQSRLRLSHSLEGLRPKTSNRGKQPAGVATPTLFDIEASYEPPPQTLPPGMPDDLEVVLLTTYLSSNGEMTQHRGGSSRSIDTSLGLSASYPCLLAWLLSLVPEDIRSLSSENPACSAPFHVIGMQQMVHDDQFALYFAVTPTQRVAPPGRGPSRKKKVQSAFQQLLSHFLSTNTLQSVSPWLRDLISMEVSGPSGDGKKPFAYRPPLPNITTRPLSTFIQINPNRRAAERILSEPIGFFWHTLEVEGHCLMRGEEASSEEPQSTMALVYKRVYRCPSSLMGILNRVLQEGLDLSGLRLLFPTPDLLGSDDDAPSKVGPVLAFALRGAFARSLWLDAVGPSDPILARQTDPNCLCALYGGESRDECLVFSPRHPSRVQTEMARWFGGRVPRSGIIDVGLRRDSLASPSPPKTLVCCTKADVFLSVSPLVPVRALGLLLATCQRRGYQLRGIRRLHLNPKRATGIGLSAKESSAFLGNNSEDLSLADSALCGPLPQRPTAVLLLQKENAAHGMASLIEALMVQMTFKNMLADIQDSLSEPLTSNFLFKATVFSENLLAQLGGDFSKVPDRDLTSPGFISPQLHSNPELEQIVVLSLTGHQRMVNFGLFLGRLLGVLPHSQQMLSVLSGGLELLGIKWLPSLSVLQAKELTPYEVGHKQWKASVRTLTSEPAVVLVLRGVNAFKRLESFVNPPVNPLDLRAVVPLDRILSPTPQLAFCQARLFFHDHELMGDDDVRTLKDFLPPDARLVPRQNKSKKSVPTESIFRLMQAGPRPICTLLVVKPHVVTKGIPKLMKKLTHEGFHIVALKQMMLSRDQAEGLVPSGDAQNEVLRNLHVDYMTSDPCLVLCLQRENAVHHLLRLLGSEDPSSEHSSFAWRAVFGTDAVANAFYASDKYSKAVADIKSFFAEGICCEENVDLTADDIICKSVDSILNLNSAKSRTIGPRDSPCPLVATRHTGAGGPSLKPLPVVSSLTQTNCIILMPSLLTSPSGRGSSRRSAPFVEILEVLLSSSPRGCGVVGARLLWLSSAQAQHCLHCVCSGSFALVPLLTRGPSLVLALQGDNAILGFEANLGSNFDKNSVLSKYGNQILRPRDSAQANQLLTFCFDHLTPEAHLQISTTDL